MRKRIMLSIIVGACFVIFALIIKFVVFKQSKDRTTGVDVALRNVEQDETRRPKKPRRGPRPHPKPPKEEPYPFKFDERYMGMLKILLGVKVSVDAEGVTVDEIIDGFSEQANIPIELSEPLRPLADEKIKVKIDDMVLEEALTETMLAIPDVRIEPTVRIEQDRVLICEEDKEGVDEGHLAARAIILARMLLEEESATEDLRSSLKEKVISVDFTEASLENVLYEISGKLGAPVLLLPKTDYDKARRLTLIERMPAEQLLDVICRDFGLEFWLSKGTVFLSDRFNHDEFIRKERESQEEREDILSFAVRIEGRITLVGLIKMLAEQRNAPRVYPSEDLWRLNPKSTLLKGDYTLKEIFSSFNPRIRAVVVKDRRFFSIALFRR